MKDAASAAAEFVVDSLAVVFADGVDAAKKFVRGGSPPRPEADARTSEKMDAMFRADGSRKR